MYIAVVKNFISLLVHNYKYTNGTQHFYCLLKVYTELVITHWFHCCDQYTNNGLRQLFHSYFVRSNDGLVLPPKPNEENRALGFYNIDFSLTNQVKTSLN